MRAIHIDARAREVREVRLVGDTLEAMQALVGGYIEVAHRFPNGDTLFVDEEGLLKSPEDWFDVGAHQPFAGSGVVVGAAGRRGETTPAASAVGDIRARFMDRSAVWAQVQRGSGR